MLTGSCRHTWRGVPIKRADSNAYRCYCKHCRATVGVVATPERRCRKCGCRLNTRNNGVLCAPCEYKGIYL